MYVYGKPQACRIHEQSGELLSGKETSASASRGKPSGAAHLRYFCVTSFQIQAYTDAGLTITITPILLFPKCQSAKRTNSW